MSLSTHPLPFPPSRTTIRSRLKLGISTSMDKHFLITMYASYGQIQHQLAVCLLPQPQLTGPPRACLSGCKSSDPTLAIARQSRSLSYLSESLAASCHLLFEQHPTLVPVDAFPLKGRSHAREGLGTLYPSAFRVTATTSRTFAPKTPRDAQQLSFSCGRVLSLGLRDGLMRRRNPIAPPPPLARTACRSSLPRHASAEAPVSIAAIATEIEGNECFVPAA